MIWNDIRNQFHLHDSSASSAVADRHINTWFLWQHNISVCLPLPVESFPLVKLTLASLSLECLWRSHRMSCPDCSDVKHCITPKWPRNANTLHHFVTGSLSTQAKRSLLILGIGSGGGGVLRASDLWSTGYEYDCQSCAVGPEIERVTVCGQVNHVSMKPVT